MADVQKEKGYTPIANKILDNIVSLPLNGTQFRIVMVVWRYTYGFSRKEHEFSETFLAKATGIHKKQIHRELAELVSYNIIQVVREATFNSPRILKFNKDYDSWEVAKKFPVSELTGNELDPSPGDEKVPSPGSELVPQDKQDLKAISKDDDDYKKRARDPDYADIVKNFEKYIFPMTERSSEMIADWQNDFTSAIIVRAITVAADNNARSIQYIDRVLTNWRNKGLKTLEQVEAYLSRNKNPPPTEKKDASKSTLDAYREAAVKLE